MTIRRITDVDLRGKVVLIRADFNVPLSGTEITNDRRILAALPTIQYALNQKAKVILVSHLGRPTAGEFEQSLSLQPIRNKLVQLLDKPVDLIQDWQEDYRFTSEVSMLENIRYHHGETTNNPDFAKQLASLCDIYINDAFGTAHRAHASTCGIVAYTSESCAGLLLASEIDALERALKNPKRPLVAVVGGAKISGKLELLRNLSQLVDSLLIGGGMANTFLLAGGNEVGKSLVEEDLIEDARSVMASSNVPLPIDVMTAEKIDSEAFACLRLREEVSANELIVDIGTETARRYAQIIAGAGTIIWNGPMGIFEHTVFAEGSRVVAEAVAESNGFSLAGGGDTIAAIEQFELSEKIDYISTGGGAFLEFIQNKDLPGISELRL